MRGTEGHRKRKKVKEGERGRIKTERQKQKWRLGKKGQVGEGRTM